MSDINPLFDIPDQVVAALQGHAELTGIVGISSRKKTSKQYMVEASAAMNGLYYMVMALRGKIVPASRQVAGPRVELTVYVTVIENAVLNRSADGTNMAAETAIYEIIRRLHCHQLPSATECMFFSDFDFIDDKPFRKKDDEVLTVGYASFTTVVNFASRANLSGTSNGPKKISN